MIVNESALKRQTTVLALLVILVITGIGSYMALPRESFPDITIPYIFVTTTYEGVSPSDMESLISIPIERKLKGLADTEELTSTSAEGISVVAVKFLPNVDMEDALRKVKDKVDEAKSELPQDLQDDPVVKEVNFQDFPIIRVIVSGPYSLRRLKSFAEMYEDRIESVPGVLEVELSGGLEREIHVEFDLDRVGAYNMPFSSLINAVNKGNVNMPGGSMDIGDGRYSVRVPEDYKHPAEIFSIVAFVRDGKPVYLKDVGRIEDSYKDPKTRSRINGQQSVTLGIKKRSGENIVAVADEVKRIVKEMAPQMPPDLKVSLTSDQSEDVRLMIKDLENNIYSGLVLVLAVIFVFVSARSAFFISLAIPYSMFIAFALLSAFGVSLNQVVLFSLILALGMLVDNGIVIVENIYRHMQEGATRWEAARKGTNEVAWPVITSTLTTLGAFLPMLFWPGIMGEFMKYLPMTLIMTLTASLFVALVINPVLSARYQRAKRKPQGYDPENPFATPLPWLMRWYHRLLQAALNHRWLVVFLSIVLFFGSIVLFVRFGQGKEFFPQADARRAEISIKAPIGANLDATDRLVHQIEEIVQGYPDVQYVITNLGSSGGGGFSGGESGTHTALVALDFKNFNERSRPSPEIINEVRQKVLSTIKGAEVTVDAERHGPPTGEPVNLEIYGTEMDVLGDLVQRIHGVMEQVEGLTDLKDNYTSGRPEIRVDVDKEKAALMGLDTYTIAYTVKTAINGSRVGSFREGKDEYDIIARLPEKDRQSLESLKRLTVSGSNGEPIPITSLATFHLTTGMGAINRKDQKRVFVISGRNTDRNANDIIKELTGRLGAMSWPSGYGYRFTGEQQEQENAQAFLSKAFLAALFIIMLILMTQFDSVVYPVIVLTSVLLSLIGVFLGLVITRTPFGVIMTGIGVISLAGVVVNNAIVLIDYYMQLLARGIPPRLALETTGLVRFRPVMLTAITTLLGLMPMATGVSVDFTVIPQALGQAFPALLSADFGLAVQRLSPILEIGSESSQWWSPMAIAVIFGLGVATLLTLVVVPVLCSMAYSVFGAPGAGPTSISPLRRWWLKRKGIDIHHGDDLMGPRIQDVEEEETAGPAGQTVDPKS